MMLASNRFETITSVIEAKKYVVHISETWRQYLISISSIHPSASAHPIHSSLTHKQDQEIDSATGVSTSLLIQSGQKLVSSHTQVSAPAWRAGSCQLLSESHRLTKLDWFEDRHYGNLAATTMDSRMKQWMFCYGLHHVYPISRLVLDSCTAASKWHFTSTDVKYILFLW